MYLYIFQDVSMNVEYINMYFSKFLCGLLPDIQRSPIN